MMALRIRLLTAATLALTAAPVNAGCPGLSVSQNDGASFVDMFGNATVDRALQDTSSTVAANFGPELPAADAASTGADFWQGPMFDSSADVELMIARTIEYSNIEYSSKSAGGANSVPEPSSVILGGIALAAMTCGKHFTRRRTH